MTDHNQNELVTLLVRHRVLPANEIVYEEWLRRIVTHAASCPGHLGVNVIRSRIGSAHLFTSVLRFSSSLHLQTWLESDDRKRLIDEIGPVLMEGDQIEVNQAREFWFNPENTSTVPPRWKQACVTFLVILPLSLLVPWLWRPVFLTLPWLGGYVASNVLITLSIVLLVVYLCMPMATRLFASWLGAR